MTGFTQPFFGVDRGEPFVGIATGRPKRPCSWLPKRVQRAVMVCGAPSSDTGRPTISRTGCHALISVSMAAKRSALARGVDHGQRMRLFEQGFADRDADPLFAEIEGQHRAFGLRHALAPSAKWAKLTPSVLIAAARRSSNGSSNRICDCAGTVSQAFCASSSSLAGRPAGIAEGDDDVAGDAFLPKDCRTSRELVRPDLGARGQRRLPGTQRSVKNEAAVGLHRAAEIDRHPPQSRLHRAAARSFEQRRQRHVDRAVDDDPCWPLVVLADVDQGAGKIGSAIDGMAMRK